MNELTHINDICLFVPDMTKAIEFYTKKMEFEIEFQRALDYVILKFQGTSLTLWNENEIKKYAIDKEYIDGNGHHFMIAIRLNNINDVVNASNHLKKNGVECIAEPKDYHWRCRAAYFKDIFGNIWELFAFL